MRKANGGRGATVIDADEALIQAIPELVPSRAEGMTIREFIASLTPFFTRARELELAAKETLGRARRTVAPKTADEDAQIQSDILQTSTAHKTAMDHWEIKLVLFRFQQRLGKARDRATGPLDEAASIWQRHHNLFVETREREANDKRDRLRREEEWKAREQREAELAQLEQQALDVEAASVDLSAREQHFVASYVATGNAEGAADAVEYKDPFKAAARLLSLPKIQAAIEAKRQAVALRNQKAAVAETPLDVQVPEVKPDLAKVGSDRTTYSVEVFDARLFIEAVIGGRHAIPADTLMPNGPKLNEYGRSMRDLVNRWPGCRLVKKTTTV